MVCLYAPMILSAGSRLIPLAPAMQSETAPGLPGIMAIHYGPPLHPPVFSARSG